MHTLAWRPALWYISKYTPEKADYCACAQSLVRIPLSLSHRDSHVAAWAEREKHKTELVPALQHSWEFICRVSSENLMYDCVHQPLHLWWCWTLLSAKPSSKNVKGICRRKHAVFLKVMTILFFPYINCCSATILRQRENCQKIQYWIVNQALMCT